MAELSWFWKRLSDYGTRECLINNGHVASYADLAREVELRVSQIQESAEAGAVVALLSDFSLEGIAALLALVRCQMIAVPIVSRNLLELETRYAEGGVEYVWNLRDGVGRIEPRSHTPNAHRLLIELRERGDAGLILFSSGSSGKPKAMLHSFGDLLASYEPRRKRSLRILAFLMYDHIGGLHTLFGALASGITLVLPERREPDAIAMSIEAYRVAVLPATPSFLSLLLMSGALNTHDLSSLRIVSYGTEPMPSGLLKRLREALPKARFIQTFGTSETGISQTVSRSSDSLAMRIDDSGTEYRIVDGELWLRSQTQIKGYLNASEERFTQDGWFKTGDLVDELDDGYLRIRGRASDIINVGGEKVFPAEIESVMLELSEVADCLAFAQPSPMTGQTVAVEVVAASGSDLTTLKRRIRRHCKERLDPFKMPVRIRFVERANVGDRFKRLRRDLVTRTD